MLAEGTASPNTQPPGPGARLHPPKSRAQRAACLGERGWSRALSHAQRMTAVGGARKRRARLGPGARLHPPKSRAQRAACLSERGWSRALPHAQRMAAVGGARKRRARLGPGTRLHPPQIQTPCAVAAWPERARMEPRGLGLATAATAGAARRGQAGPGRMRTDANSVCPEACHPRW